MERDWTLQLPLVIGWKREQLPRQAQHQADYQIDWKDSFLSIPTECLVTDLCTYSRDTKSCQVVFWTAAWEDGPDVKSSEPFQLRGSLVVLATVVAHPQFLKKEP